MGTWKLSNLVFLHCLRSFLFVPIAVPLLVEVLATLAGDVIQGGRAKLDISPHTGETNSRELRAWIETSSNFAGSPD
jgi:hypothetical protein